MAKRITFKPRPSSAWLWLCILVIAIAAILYWRVLPLRGRIADVAFYPVAALLVCLAAVLLLFWYWLSTMRYVLEKDTLTILFGPVIRWHIPIDEIRGMRRRNLANPPLFSFRLPGLALFTVYYEGTGSIRMCATSVNKNILVLETKSGLYGINPENEKEFVAIFMNLVKTGKLEIIQ